MWPFKRKSKPTDPYKRFPVKDDRAPIKSVNPALMAAAMAIDIAAHDTDSPDTGGNGDVGGDA